MTLNINTSRALERLDSKADGVSVKELKQVDADNNGTITAEEAAVQGINPTDASTLNQVYQAHASNPNALAFSRSEISAHKVSHFALQNFTRIDGDRDGYLSKSELNTALHSNQYQGEDAAAIATLYAHVSDLEEYANDETGDENDGVTRADLEAYTRQARQTPNDQTVKNINNLFDYANAKLSGQNRALFPNGVNSIRPDNIRQALIGDCYYLSAIASMARTPQGRQQIQNMIQDNNNNTYTVTFPGQSAVTINAPTDAELALYSSAGQDGMWLSVLEKAYAQHTSNNTWVFTAENPYDEIGSGAFLSAGVSVMTGHSTDSDDISFTSTETTHRKLSDAMRNGRVVTAGIRGNMPFTTPQRDNGLPMGHAYSVINYDPTTRMVTLRNPWGHSEPRGANGQAADGNNDGTFTISLADFESNFSNICYEEGS